VGEAFAESASNTSIDVMGEGEKKKLPNRGMNIFEAKGRSDRKTEADGCFGRHRRSEHATPVSCQALTARPEMIKGLQEKSLHTATGNRRTALGSVLGHFDGGKNKPSDLVQILGESHRKRIQKRRKAHQNGRQGLIFRRKNTPRGGLVVFKKSQSGGGRGSKGGSGVGLG